MKQTLPAILLSIPLLLGVPQISSAQEPQELSIKINRLNRQEAESRIQFIEFKLLRLEQSENLAKDYQEIKDELSDLLKKSDDRQIQYCANFLMARLYFEKDKGTFSETFSLLEKCIFEYSNQEKKFGLVYDALSSINERFSKEKRLIGTSITYELAQLSPYPKKDLRPLKNNLDSVLDTDIGNSNLKKSLEKMFSADKIQGHANFNRYEKTYIAALPKEFVMALSGPKTKFEEICITSDVKIFPRIIMKDVIIKSNKSASLDYTQNLFFYYRDKISLTNKIKERCKAYSGNLKNYPYGTVQQHSQNWAQQLNYQGVVVHEDDILSFIINNRKVEGFMYPIMVKPGVKIRDFLEKGGVNPYDWAYKDAQKITW